jgi:hypothetical protein
MKTFKEFLYVCEDIRKLTDITGPGVPSERPTSTTSLQRLASRIPSDLAKPKGSTAGVPTIPLNQATYQGRVEAGKIQKKDVADNPNYQGALRGSGFGTRDRMPGTTPSNNPKLPPIGTKNPSGTKFTGSIKPPMSPIGNFI